MDEDLDHLKLRCCLCDAAIHMLVSKNKEKAALQIDLKRYKSEKTQLTNRLEKINEAIYRTVFELEKMKDE